MNSTPKKSNARKRLLETAERLFYCEGIRAVGVDRIIAEAEVAKTTLYSHFPSKDDLILAALKKREVDIDNMFERSIEKSVQKGGSHLEGFFAALKKWFQESRFRGCSFINAAVELADAEHQGSQFSTAHKKRFHARIQEIIAEDYNDSVARQAGPAVSLLVEGAIINAVLMGSAKSADTAKEAAYALIEAIVSQQPSN